jgi:hypothetical protein
LEAIGDGDGAKVNATVFHAPAKDISEPAKMKQMDAGSKKCCSIL